MKKFVLIFGPQAVGKMTVGQELAKMTDLKLFHNHMTIDLLEPLYGFSSEMWRLTHLFRKEIFQSFSKSEHYGMILHTYGRLMKRKIGMMLKVYVIFFVPKGLIFILLN